MSGSGSSGGSGSSAGWVAALERLAASAPGSGERPHARVDRILARLAGEEVEAIGRILQRWANAGHPPGSIPEPSDMEADDTGNVFDGDSKSLIATPGEWEVFERLHAALVAPEE